MVAGWMLTVWERKTRGKDFIGRFVQGECWSKLPERQNTCISDNRCHNSPWYPDNASSRDLWRAVHRFRTGRLVRCRPHLAVQGVLCLLPTLSARTDTLPFLAVKSRKAPSSLSKSLTSANSSERTKASSASSTSRSRTCSTSSSAAMRCLPRSSRNPARIIRPCTAS